METVEDIIIRVAKLNNGKSQEENLKLEMRNCLELGKSLIAQKRSEFEGLAQEKTKLETHLMSLLEKTKALKKSYNEKIDRYADINTETALSESRFQLENARDVSDLRNVDSSLISKHKDVKDLRESLKGLLSEYRNTREQFAANQEEILNISGNVRRDTLKTLSYIKKIQASVNSEFRTLASSAADKSHKQFLHSCIAEVGERTISARDEIKQYVKSKLMDMRRRENIALEAFEKMKLEGRYNRLTKQGRLSNHEENDEEDEEDDDDDEDNDSDSSQEAENSHKNKDKERNSPKKPGSSEKSTKFSTPMTPERSQRSVSMIRPTPPTNSSTSTVSGNYSPRRLSNLNISSSSPVPIASKPLAMNNLILASLSSGMSNSNSIIVRENRLFSMTEYLSNYIGDGSAPDNLIPFILEVGEIEGHYARLKGIEHGLENHVMHQASLLHHFSEMLKDLYVQAQDKKKKELKALNKRNLKKGLTLNIPNDGKEMSSHLCFDSLFPQLNQLETLLLQGGLGSLLQTNGSIAASPSHDIARRKQQPSKISVADPSILPSTNSINNSNQSSNLLNQDRSWLPVVEDLVKNEWNQCPSSIPYCEQDYEASDLAYLKELFTECEKQDKDILSFQTRIKNKIAAKEIRSQYEQDSAEKRRKENSLEYIRNDKNRLYFNTENERRLFDIPLADMHGNALSYFNASKSSNDTKPYPSVLRKGPLVREFIHRLFEGNSISYSRSHVASNKSSLNYTDLNIESGLVKLGSVVDNYGSYLRQELSSAPIDLVANRRPGGGGHNHGYNNSNNGSNSNNNNGNNTSTNQQPLTRKISIPSLSHL